MGKELCEEDMNSPLTYMGKIRLSSWLFAVYLLFLPVSTAVSGFIVSTSIISILGILYVGVSVVEMIRED